MNTNKFTTQLKELEEMEGSVPQILIDLINETTSLKTKLVSTTSNVNKAKSRLDNIEKTTVEKMIEETQEHVSNLQEVVSVAVTKIAVSTELNFYLKEDNRLLNTLVGVNKAMDYNDKFWRETNPVELKDLADMFYKIGCNDLEATDINRLTVG